MSAFHAVSKSLFLSLLFIAIQTAYAGQCGDANSDDLVNGADVVYIMEYMFNAGPPPAHFDSTDMDRHKELTMVDAIVLTNSLFTCDLTIPPCPPVEPPLGIPYYPAFKVYYNGILPAGESMTDLELFIVSESNAVWGVCLPLKIRVDGEIPDLDPAEFPASGSTFEVGIATSSVDQDSGIVSLGGVTLLTGLPEIEVSAVFPLSIASAPEDRFITLEWEYLTPENAPGPDSTVFPMLGGYCGSFAIRPRLAPCCCELSGGPNGDGVIDIDDAVYLIQYIFVSGPGPVPNECCGNVDGVGSVDIDDVVYLISFIFGGGPPPQFDC
jgi:hypothetical protein